MSRPVDKIWRTKDGRQIRICDMENSHLANAIAYTERVRNGLADALVNLARMHREEEGDRYVDQFEEPPCSLYEDLCYERDWRKNHYLWGNP